MENEILKDKYFLIWANQPYGRDNCIETFSLPEFKNQNRYERYTDLRDVCGASNAHLRTLTNDDGICRKDCKWEDMKNTGGI